jgi:hypothetical protein
MLAAYFVLSTRQACQTGYAAIKCSHSPNYASVTRRNHSPERVVNTKLLSAMPHARPTQTPYTKFIGPMLLHFGVWVLLTSTATQIRHFPIQNWLKIMSRRSSVVVLPTISPIAFTAIRKSSATNSSVAPCRNASSVRAVAARARFNAS